jgi:hypothetical protein
MATTQFIWLYLHNEAEGEELRYSMRSVYKHFQGTPKITLVGDRPDWYCGHYISMPRITTVPDAAFHGLFDTSHKLHTAIQRDDVDDEFVVMMDDHYFLRPVTLADLRVPRAQLSWTPRLNHWWEVSITRTMQALERRGKSTHLFETHLMHVFERSKLLTIFDTFDMHNVPLARNTLYGNIYRDFPQNCRPFVSSPQSKQSKQQLNKLAASGTVLNHASHCWDSTLHNWLNARFNEVTEVEACHAVCHAAPVAV